MTEAEKNDFAAFCRGATDRQLSEIIRKEAAARRADCVRIAQAEVSARARGAGK